MQARTQPVAMDRSPSRKTLPRSMSSASTFGRKSDFSDVNTTMQSFRKMKTATVYDRPGPGACGCSVCVCVCVCVCTVRVRSGCAVRVWV